MLLLLLAFGAFPSPASLVPLAQDADAPAPEEAPTLPLLTPRDYERWESLGWGPHALSPDGRWLAYPIEKGSGDKELRLCAVEAEVEIERIYPHASHPEFSADSRHLLWTSSPPAGEEEPEGAEATGGVALLNLETLELTDFPTVSAARFDASGRFLALQDDPAENGADLRVLDTLGGELSFGKVSEFAWSEEGSLLAFLAHTANEGGNGARLFEPEDGRLRELETSAATYRGLSWCPEASHLAVHRWEDPEDESSPTAVLLWRDLDGPTPTALILEPEDEALPADLRVDAEGELGWQSEGERLLFDARTDQVEPQAEQDHEPSGVQIWHPRDVRIFPEQELQLESDRKASVRAAWDLRADSVVRLGNDPRSEVSIAPRGRFALEATSQLYPWENMFGRPYHDAWRIDLSTGERSLLLERVRYSWISPEATHALTFDGAHYHALRLEDGQRTPLTEGLDTSFADLEHDSPTELLPPYGVGGWLEGDRAVLLYDRYDVWRIALDGSSARRLTAGAERGLRYRVEVLDEEEEAIDPQEALYFATWSDASEERGYARLTSEDEVAVDLFLLPKLPGRLTRAEEADVFVFTLQAIDDSPDYFTSGPDLGEPRRLSQTNPFQAEFAWTRAELVDFESEAGVPLQGALYYPAQHDPSRTYPLIVWTYERETPWVHIYDVPDESDYYNFTTWTQRGYFVLLMDIAYRPRDPGLSAIEAVRPAIGSLVERGLVDAERVGLVGHSWGGYQAAYLPTRTDLFAASVAGAPLTDFVSFMGQIHWNQGIPEPDHWETGQARMEVPYWEDPEAHLRNSPLHGIQDLETPILLAHGTEDGVVEFFQSTVFYNYARRAQKQVVLLAYEGEDHSFRQEANQIDYHRRILEWFDHYLQGAEAPDWIREGVPVVELESEKQRVARDGFPAELVGLNHVYAVLDAETFEGVRSSSFLGEDFANADAGLPDFAPIAADGQSIYIRGKDTYIELFGPENRFGLAVGQVGLALGVDAPEHLDEVQAAWSEQLEGEVMRQLQEWRAVSPSVPWYEALLHPDTLASPVAVVWASVYRPEFLPWLYPERELSANGVRRADFLAPRFDPQLLLENVTGVTLALPADLARAVARQLEAVGYARTDSGSDVRLESPEWALTLVESDAERTGLISLELATTRAIDGARVRSLGARSTLVFGPEQSATWLFH